MPTQYDSSIIQEYADKLYKSAGTIVALCAMGGLITGGIGGSIIGSQGGGIFFAIFGLIAGMIYGNGRALDYKLKAQLALCQAQIEKNTRPAP